MQPTTLTDIAKLFFKLGVIGFGGPAAHIAMMQREVVEKKQWLTQQQFIDLVGATNLIPGPNSTEMAIHIGREKGGWKGLLIAGACFILPAVVITGIIAYFYKQYSQLPQVQPFIYGITPAIIAIILAAIKPLAKQSIKSLFLAVLAMVVLGLSLFGLPEIYLMFGAGITGLLVASGGGKQQLKSIALLPFPLLQVGKFVLLGSINAKLFWIFLKIGAILYGSGYVLFAFLDAELVTTGIITRQQLADAIAVGQFTPGPVFSAVTFLGYQVNGFSGAALSTVAIFLPAFLFVALLNPLVKKMRNSRLFSSFLDAVNVASVAIIVAICFQMGKTAITDWRTVLIAVLSIIVAFGYPRVNAAFIVLGGSAAGYMLSLIGS